MTLPSTDYYQRHLAELHSQLILHRLARNYLSGTGIRFDGELLGSAHQFILPSGAMLSAQEFAHLFSIFNESRVHQQAQKFLSRDDAPPGIYFTVINTKLIKKRHKNRSGLFEDVTGSANCSHGGLHIDHFFLNEGVSSVGLGTISFGLLAITAHRAGLRKISLIAAGGPDHAPQYIGFKVWPRLGFNAGLFPGETQSAPHLHQCQSVLEILAKDQSWWDEHGSQRLMTFDLDADSLSWRKLIKYLSEKLFVGVQHVQ